MKKQLISAAATAALITLAGAAPVAAQQACAGGYTIRSGDTLASVAQRCGTTIPALLSVNPAIRDDQDMDVGGRLRIPPPDTRPTSVEACGGFYSARTGDTLREIAEKCGLTVPLLVAANPVLANEENLRTGSTVRIPFVPRPGTAFEPVIVGGADGVAEMAAAAAAARDSAASDSAADATEAPVPFDTYEGVLRAGDRCTILRTADGTDVGVVGELGPGFDMGDRVGVTGPAAGAAECGTARTVRVRIMWRPR